jgi:hypothetical protein
MSRLGVQLELHFQGTRAGVFGVFAFLPFSLGPAGVSSVDF